MPEVASVHAGPSATLPGFNDTLPTGAKRFAPDTYEQMIVAVLTMWNLLDANINAAQLAGNGYKSPYGTPYGYMRPVQLHAYTQSVWKNPHARTYCEIGLNGGHGTAAMLEASPDLVAHSFDMGAYGYSNDAYRLLALSFGDRFQLHRGDSMLTVPEFAAAHQSVACDVILIDGDHRLRGCKQDMINMRQLAGCNATVFIDDISMPPGAAVNHLVQTGVLKVLEWHRYKRHARENPCLRLGHPGSTRRLCDRAWGWAKASYVQPGRCPG
jgi:hypothetical protein